MLSKMGRQLSWLSDTKPDFHEEQKHGGCVAGIDEAGRGTLAGPVVAAAVVLHPLRIPEGLDDSKKLSVSKREHLFEVLAKNAVVGVGQATVEEIDRLNILCASMLAMCRAFDALPLVPDACLVDGNCAPTLPRPVQLMVKGDQRSLSIAAASIVAKVTRDRIMTKLAVDYPAYGWEKNAGYCVPEHLKALQLVGPSPHHRLSFAPVKAALCNNHSLINF